MPAQKRPLPDPDFNEQGVQEEESATREQSPNSSLHQNGFTFPNDKPSRSPSPSQEPVLHDPGRGGDGVGGEEEEEVEVNEGEVEEEEEEDDGDGDEKEGDDDDEVEDEEEKQEDEDTNGYQSSSSEDEKPEFVAVDLREIRKDVQCPICLGIIKKTRTVMECLHRFCRECIDKSMRMGNNECPACRTHCASRRSLRDDPNYDALIAALYPDIGKYEKEEFAFHEEEKARNKQIQASIAQVLQRQSEALVRRRTMGKEASSFLTRTQRNSRTRRRRNSRGNDFQGSEDCEEENDDNGGKDSSSADELSIEHRQKRCKRRSGSRPLQPSSSAPNAESGTMDNDSEVSREYKGISPGFIWNTEMLAWGRGGARSHTRHGNANNGNSKNPRNTRVSKLVDHLRSLDDKNDELNVKLISLDSGRTPSLRRPYLCCRPSLSVKQLCQYISQQTLMQNEEVEVMLVKGDQKHDNKLSTPPVSVDEIQLLKEEETLGEIKDGCISERNCLIAYRRKKTNS